MEILYIEKGQKACKNLDCKGLTFFAETGEFKLYFHDNRHPVFIKPKYLTVVSFDEPTVTIKEEYNGQIKTA